MTFSLTWLPKVLMDAGLKVAEVPGWQNRGADDRDIGGVLGVLCHHTGVRSKKNMPTLNALINGRAAEKNLKAIPGPLAQLGLGRDGTFYVIAAGRANHAGTGMWRGISSGNTHFIGIEAENSGDDDDKWPPVQIEAYQRGVAAILKHIGQPAIFCAGHKEYAPDRKDDPSFEMVPFRAAVEKILGG
jgi:hypothetical protein